MSISSNTSKVRKNLISGFASQTLIMLMGIFIPRLVIVNYGSDVNGFLHSITQVFTCFELIEAGIGTATLQALLKQIASSSHDEINSVLSAANILYRRVGIIYTLGTLCVAFIYPLLVVSSLGYIKMSLIILLQGIPNSFGYFVSAKFKILLSADGRNYIQNNIGLTVKFVSNVAKISLILLGYEVLAVQFVFFIINLLQILAYKAYEKRQYGWIDYNVDPDYCALSESKYVFIHQLSGLIFENTDILVLTFLAGLPSVSVYSVYMLPLSVLSTLLNTISSSTYFYLGQTFSIDRHRYMKLHDMYEAAFSALSFSLFTTAYILFKPFIALYTSGMSDAVYLDSYLPLLFVAIKLLATVRTPSLNVINFAQEYKSTQSHAIIEMTINVVFSIIGAWLLGIYGVLLGTIAALLYRGNVMICFSNQKVLGRSCLVSYRRAVTNILLFVCFAYGTKLFPLSIHNFIQFFIIAVPVTLVTALSYFCILFLFDRQVVYDIVEMKILKKFFNK